ncbi:hypothetical protein AruPA_17125 [Acidiphilium sp. PA]|uniref:hypothetical protein n=1 Tax=Acidiphilium sp. PA TaxID=2871705 RepID=UPI0022430422|nr:hypothetical protein [Acidiphilium sp. PA]MCW8308759.1 hypothetical protein [Acidiphilium sp. PA]
MTARLSKALLIASAIALPLAITARAATSTQGSSAEQTAGCVAMANGAAAGISAGLSADSNVLTAPTPVTQLTCLSNFFHGVGLNLITSVFSASTLTSIFQDVEGQICASVNQAWQNATSSVSQCGISISGFQIGGFGTTGFGNFCPQLSFGGGGANLLSVTGSPSLGQNTGIYVNGTSLMPTGYPAPQTTQGSAGNGS